MDKKTIFSGLIIILAVAVGYCVIHQPTKVQDVVMVQNSPVDSNLPSKELTDEFIKIQTTVGLDGENIIDERIVKDGAEPRSMRIGFPKSVTHKDGKYFLNIDLALWFDDDYSIDPPDKQASLASKEDGYTYEAPNGFYIRNKSHAIKTFEVSDYALIYTIDVGSGTPYPAIHISDFKSLVEKDVLNTLAPFVFDLSNNIITKAYQHYTP